LPLGDTRMFLHRKEILEELFAGSGEDGLGVELYAFEFIAAVADAHDDAVVGLCGNGKFAWKRFALDDERVIPRGDKRPGQFAEDAFAVVMNLAGFSVKQLRRTYDFSAERFTNCLVAQTDAENRELPREFLHQFDRNACLPRRARARRNNDGFGFALRDVFDGNLIVAMNFDGATEFAEILREVVGEGVVVVEEQDHFE
jgi:hypothetical protein